MHINKDDATAFHYQRYRKKGTTEISDEVIPAGTKVATLEGDYRCSEQSRIARDVKGNVYPIAESVFSESYEKAD